MEITEFTEAASVVHTLDALKAFWQTKPIVSDIIDDDGHQYVDLVMEGGGVLGIALVGYAYALESVGIRFLGIGGTSAGAITATLLAALGKPNEAKSIRVLECLAGLEMFEFVDGDHDAKDFIRTMLEGAGPVKLGWKAIQVLDNLRDDLGLNPGDTFLKWIKTQLRTSGIRTVADLNTRFSELPPNLRVRDKGPLSVKEAGACLKVVAADVTTETKVVFPEMASLYFKDPEKVNPGQFVRASMSIPLFFHPYRMKRLPQGVKALREWKKVGYEGSVPKEIVFMDGGIMSNFPIDLFHDPTSKEAPVAPTFGARLGTARVNPNLIEKPTQLLMSVFNSARHCNDYDFLSRHPDFKHLVTQINTGTHNWLDFFLAPEAKVDLFTRGVEAAAAWIKGFNWKEYKKLRGKLAKAI
ncbi:MAG: patatin-like phospholipase family protein [Phycisphaerae bacterium]|nr:patatin-like phospholipase family protein [Phycisphaerae bacterium]